MTCLLDNDQAVIRRSYMLITSGSKSIKQIQIDDLADVFKHLEMLLNR